MIDQTVDMLSSTLRMATPLVLASMGGLYSERSGVVNIALEGFILFGSFAAALGAYQYSSPHIGLLFAAVIGLLSAALYALCVIEWKLNQIVAGTAINLLAMGLTPFLCKLIFDSSTASQSLPIEARYINFPTLFAFAFVLITYGLLRYSAWGLRLTFAGEHTEALATAGLKIRAIRWQAVLISGVIAAIAGASLSIQLSSSFTRNMSAGRGFMALAALIVGRWKPIPTCIACLGFAFSDAVQMQLQGVVLWGTEPVPVQFIQMLPYVVTLLILVLAKGRVQAPAALGQ